jgi:hypothetical protein
LGSHGSEDVDLDFWVVTLYGLVGRYQYFRGTILSPCSTPKMDTVLFPDMDSSLYYHGQNGSGTHPASNLMGTGAYLSWGKVGRAWR